MQQTSILLLPEAHCQIALPQASKRELSGVVFDSTRPCLTEALYKSTLKLVKRQSLAISS